MIAALVVLLFGLQGATTRPQFGWRPPDVAQAELRFPESRNGTLPHRNVDQPSSCQDLAETLQELKVERVKLGPVELGRDSSYTGEVIHCREQANGPSASFLVLSRPTGSPSAHSWVLKLGDAVTGLGFREDRPFSNKGRLVQPGVAPLDPPGFAVVQFEDEMYDNGGHHRSFNQILLDLTGPEPVELVRGFSLLDGGGVACRGPVPDDSSYSCSWDKKARDFACEEKGDGNERTFLLRSRRPVSRPLGITVAPKKAKVGDLIRIPRVGLARVVANLSPTLQLGWSNGRGVLSAPPTTPSRSTSLSSAKHGLGEFEVNEVEPIRVLELKAPPDERIFDVVQGTVQSLVRYVRGSNSVSTVQIADSSLQLADACRSYVIDAILTARPAEGGIDVLYQPSTGGRYTGEEDRLCPSEARLSWEEPYPRPTAEEEKDCARPMVPLVPMPRLGRPSLLLAKGHLDREDAQVEFELRGLSKGTFVIVGWSEDDWAQSLDLPDDVEILRISISDSDPTGRLMPEIIQAISARRVAVIAQGFSQAELTEAFGILNAKGIEHSTLDLKRPWKSMLKGILTTAQEMGWTKAPPK